jgi:hypothetical protein
MQSRFETSQKKFPKDATFGRPPANFKPTLWKPEPTPDPAPPPKPQPKLDTGLHIFPHEQIMQDVAHKHGLTVEQLRGRKHRLLYAKARNEAYYELRKDGTRSLTVIGQLFSGRDHTTVLQGINKHMEGLEL